jgi:hypothetical protein
MEIHRFLIPSADVPEGDEKALRQKALIENYPLAPRLADGGYFG